MTLPTDPLLLAIELYRLPTAQTFERNVTVQPLPETEDFEQVVQTLREHNLEVRSSESNRLIEFQLPSGGDDFFAFDLPDLIQNASRRSKVPARFYLADQGLIFDKGSANIAEIPAQVRGYLDAVQLAAALRQLADHVYLHAGVQRLVFLGKSKIEIAVDYQCDDLRHIPELEAFVSDFVDSDNHKTQKAAILRATLSEMFGNAEVSAGESIKLADLIRRFAVFYPKMHHGYQLYVSEFSFEKVKSQIEKEKVDFITRLNKVFSDIQNQLLAVPAALVLAGGQMKAVGELKESNLMIMGGVIVFAIFMTLLVRNQKNTLYAVKREIEHQQNQIKDQHIGIADQFKETFNQLDDRFGQQKWLLRVVDLFVALVLAATTSLLFFYSSKDASLLMAFWKYAALPLMLGFALYCFFESKQSKK